MVRPFLFAALLFASTCLGQLPGPAIPGGLGCNIHFVVPDEREPDAIAAVGYRFVRMDFTWAATERQAGVYDFSGYDKLVAAMAKRDIRCLFILDYANRLYDGGLAPHTDAGRAAFAKWAAAAAKHFAGKKIIWEVWNEPNLAQFWKPEPSAEHYALLVDATVAAMRKADPAAFIVGPASSGFPWPYIEELIRRGTLAKFDAISVHPYRQSPPESAAADYHKLRLLLARAGLDKPILSGEWGYSAGWKNFDEAKQGLYLPRQWLTNVANDVPLSIWYDWKDDGDDPKEPEHHFGSVRRKDLSDKPAATAARTLTKELDGFEFLRRLWTGKEDEHVLLFRKGWDTALVAWTIGTDRPIFLRLPYVETRVVDLYGKPASPTFYARKELDNDLNPLTDSQPPKSDNPLVLRRPKPSMPRPQPDGLRLVLTSAPQYISQPRGGLGWGHLIWRPTSGTTIIRGPGGEVAVRVDSGVPGGNAKDGRFELLHEGTVIGEKRFAYPTNTPITVRVPFKLPRQDREHVRLVLRLSDHPLQTAMITALVLDPPDPVKN